MRELSGHTAPVLSLAYSPDGALLASVGLDKALKIWNTAQGTQIRSIPLSSGSQSVAFSPDGTLVATGCNDGMVHLQNVVSWEQIKTFDSGLSLAWFVTFAPDSETLAIFGPQGSELGNMRSQFLFWKTAIEEFSGKYPATNENNDRFFFPDGIERIFTRSGHVIELDPWSTSELPLEGLNRDSAVYNLAITPDNRRLIGNTTHGTDVWDVDSGRSLMRLPENDWVTNIATSHDGTMIASSGRDGRVIVYKSATEADVAQWAREKEEKTKNRLQKEQELERCREAERKLRSTDNGVVREWLIADALIRTAPSIDSRSIGFRYSEDIRELLSTVPEIEPRLLEDLSSGNLKSANWRRTTASPDGIIDLDAAFAEETSYSIAYAACWVDAPEDMEDAVLMLGCDDGAKVYINGDSVMQRTHIHPIEIDGFKAAGVKLKKGRNLVLLKAYNLTIAWTASLRITDSKGDPIPGLTSSIEPPASTAL